MLKAMKEIDAWEARSREGGAFAPRVVRRGNLIMAEWPGVGRLRCADGGARARFVADPGADPAAVAKLRQGAVKALVQDLRGGLSLHASAVATKAGAVLFVGASGAGKSTAAGELCLHYGGRLLADDMTCLSLDESRASVVPTERSHFLTAASMRLLGLGRRPTPGGKGMVPARKARSAVPLALLVALRRDGRRRDPSLRRLSGAETVRALLSSIVRFDIRAPRGRELDQILALYRACPVVEVGRPTREDASSLVGRVLIGALEQGLVMT